jgi:glycosyltransferase involved in cell wall biosynthesis
MACHCVARHHALRYGTYMKVVIATGIFPPEVGGPAYYSKELSDALRAEGHDVRIVLYGSLKKFPTGVRHLLYACKIMWSSFGTDAVLAFDTYSVGLPAVLACTITRVPVIIRIGGDFIYESYSERTKDLLPLPDVYTHKEKWNQKECMIYRIQQWVIRRTHLAFSCTWIRDIWQHEYDIPSSSIHVIENPIPERIESKPAKRRNFLLYTRPLALKNNDAFRTAFIKAKNLHPDIELEEGTLSKDELMKRMQECYAVVLPSISDVTPNYIIDAIRCGKPFMLTKHSGYAERFKNLGVIIDPLSIEDMTRGVMALCEEKTYDMYRKRIAEFTEVRTFTDVAREFAALVTSIRASSLRR